MTFTEFASNLILDSGEPFRVEAFQSAFIADVEAGIPQCWLVCPEGQGKTTLISALALYRALTVEFASIPVAASTADQAKLIWRSGHAFIERSHLEGWKALGGYKEIRCLDNHSLIKVFAADAASGDGILPDLAIIDELHRHRDMDLYQTWAGKLDKRQGQLVVISTAGEPGSEFESMRENIRQMATDVKRERCYGRYYGEGVVMHEWAIPDDGNVEDIELVKAANPLSTITIESLTKKRKAPTMTLPHWSRFTCNKPTRSVLSAITEAEWLKAKGDGIPAGQPIALGLDVGWKYDATAMVPWWQGISSNEGIRAPNGSSSATFAAARLGPASESNDSASGTNVPSRLGPALSSESNDSASGTNVPSRLGPATILVPPGNGDMLALESVLIALETIHNTNPIHTVVMDITGARDVANFIETELGAIVIDRGTSLTAQVSDYQAFMQALREGKLTHTGDPGLTRHALNAIAKLLPGGSYVFGRPVSSRTAKGQELRRIDALVAAAMVHCVMSTSTQGSVYDNAGIMVITADEPSPIRYVDGEPLLMALAAA